MGACANICQSDVEFEQINMKISKKNVETLERFSQGAAARRSVKQIKIECIKQIIGKLFNPQVTILA
jgi:hypothetical protein